MLTDRSGISIANSETGQTATPDRKFASVCFTEALLDAGIAPSIGTVGDGLDNALIESTIGLYKTELIEHDGTRSWGRAEVERETASWVHWFNATIRGTMWPRTAHWYWWSVVVSTRSAFDGNQPR